jgi:predicted ATPase
LGKLTNHYIWRNVIGSNYFTLLFKAPIDFIQDVQKLFEKTFTAKQQELVEREKDVEERETRMKEVMKSVSDKKVVKLLVGNKIFYTHASVLNEKYKDCFFSLL